MVRSGLIPSLPQRRGVIDMPHIRTAPDVQQQQQQPVEDDDHEPSLASAWEALPKDAYTIMTTPTADSNIATPVASHQLSTAEPSSPARSFTTTDSESGELTPPPTPSTQRSASPEQEQDDEPSGDDASGDEASISDGSTVHNFELAEDGDSDDGLLSETEETLLPIRSGVSSGGLQHVPSVPSSIPNHIDVSFAPRAPARNLTILQGRYFAARFIDCKFHGPVTFNNCLISNTTFWNCTFEGTCRFDNADFQSVLAVDCEFYDSWYTNKAPLKAHAQYIGEFFIGERESDTEHVIESKEDPRWIKSQYYTRETWAAPSGESEAAPSGDTESQMPQPEPSQDPFHEPPAQYNDPIESEQMTAAECEAKSGHPGLEVSTVPVEADVKFDRRPCHGFSMDLGPGGMCTSTTFRKCEIDGITFINCVLLNVSFYGCTLKGVTFTNCVLINSEFRGCKMNGTVFTNDKLENVELVGHEYHEDDREDGLPMPEQLKNRDWLAETMSKLNMPYHERMKLHRMEKKKHWRRFGQAKSVRRSNF